jgi:hypothetical protein
MPTAAAAPLAKFTPTVPFRGPNLIDQWRLGWAADADKAAIAARAAGCFDLANLEAEKAHAHRAGFTPTVLPRRAELALADRIQLSKKDERVFDQLRDEGVELSHSRPFGPSRKASPRCESGGHDYCTCPRCWG